MKIHILSQVQLYNDAIQIEDNLKRNGHVIPNYIKKQSCTSILQKYVWIFQEYIKYCQQYTRQTTRHDLHVDEEGVLGNITKCI